MGGWAHRLWVAAGLIWLGAMLMPAAAQQPGEAPRTVLVINTFHDGVPWQHAFNGAFGAALAAEAPGSRVFFERLDAGRTGQVVAADVLRAYLSTKYAEIDFDAIVTDSNAAATFVSGAPDLFAPARRLYVNTHIDPRPRPGTADAHFRVTEDYTHSLAEMIRLADPRRVVIVGDGIRHDRAPRIARFRQAAESMLDGREILDLSNEPFDVLVPELQRLGPGDAVFYLLLFSDETGKPLSPFEGAKRVAAASGAPVFTEWGTLIGSGIVGGSLLSADRVGREAARALLSGQSGRSEPDPNALREFLYDFQALSRFGLDGKALPEGAVMVNAPQSIFTTDPEAIGTIMTVGLLLLTLSALLLLLLRQRNQALARSEEEGKRLNERIETHTAELRRSEALLNATGAIAGVGGWELDIPTRSVRWTRETYAIHDLQDRKEPVPLENALDFYPPGARETVTAAVDRAMRLGEPFDIEVEFVTAKGRRLWTRSICQPEMTNGKVVRLRGAFQDITARKATENALMEARRQAEQANAAKSRFLAAMSHDLRTPLNAILGFSDLMRQQVFGRIGDPRYEGYVDDIYRSGELLISLINDVLDLSKIEAGKYELAEEPLDVTELCETGQRQIAPLARRAEVTVDLDMADRLPRLRGDDRAFAQVLNNLLSNAVKFTPAGGTVTIAASVDPAGGITVAVTDSGIGMEPSDIQRALAPYEQADPQISRQHQGTGLGLYLCWNLMALFGGRLEIESTPGEGTSVTCSFPPERSMPPV